MGRSRRWSHLSVLFVLAISLIATAFAQSPNSGVAENSAAHLRLGQSAFPLNGPWKFITGDSPIDPKTGQPLWAEPNFDDSKWETVDLSPVDGSFDPTLGTAGFVPGWTTKGHPGYWGYAWYRIRVQVDVKPGEKLALASPSSFDDVFQLFDNGVSIGSFGDFSHTPPTEYYAEPMMFPLPQRSEQNAEGQETLVLAVRMWMSPITLASQIDVGGLHGAPFLGDAGAIEAGYRLRRLDLFLGQASGLVQTVLFVLLALGAFSLILFDRSDPVYLWIGAVFLLTALYYSLSCYDSVVPSISITADILLVDCLLTPLIFAGWAMVWWVWFGRPRPRWTPLAAILLAILLSVSRGLAEELFFGLVPHTVASHFELVSLVVRLLLTAFLVWIVVQGIRSQGLEGWLALPAVLLRGIGSFTPEFIVLLHLQLSVHIYGISIGPQTITNILLVAVLSVLLLRRLRKSIKAQRELALDVKQAQEVQHVILPEAHIDHPGLAIESVYRPAREVGGDFFQIIPHPTDGSEFADSLLIVAGDVAGKGLQAGMLVALLVGAIRSTAELNSNPEFILKALNRRLMGRGDAAATCLAMRITAGGGVTLANAGHLPPYLNGQPVAMEGALPLGMIESAEPSLMHFQLQPKDRLVLISDGILEATDPEGQFFGFERIDTLLASETSATALADAAQKFGQLDDISVISLTRTPILQPAALSS